MGEYRANLRLSSDATLTMYMFSHKEHRWIYEYTHAIREGRVVVLDNKQKLVVNYTYGDISTDVVLSMNITNYKRRGKEFFLGVDVSENSKLYIEFHYKKIGDTLKLARIEQGAFKIFDLENSAGIIKPVNFPYTVMDKIPLYHGYYPVPFMRLDGGDGTFNPPDSILR